MNDGRQAEAPEGAAHSQVEESQNICLQALKNQKHEF